ncbi:adenosine deaminase [Polycladidibacter hongkongensis]|uniref:adenosine deaminase n=1 Tax=Polycladidibacter hongkongensis TaxID=1647556 RepID=UPI0008349B7F|nr:adenosine deaminase [Pseudovibrio hongkongensis]
MLENPGLIPRAELHAHIEGAALPDLVRQQAAKYNEDVSRLFDENGEYNWTDFTTFLKQYDDAAALFKTEEDYALLAETYFRFLAAEGAIYGEVFISPDHANLAGLSYRAYLDALGEGILRARQATGVEGRLIATGVRHFGVDSVERAAKAAVETPHPLMTGFGFAGDERQGHPSNFAKAFDIAREAGLGLTAHAGEFGGPESVRDALDFFKVSRIGHGVRAIEDGALVERLVEEGITLECCPGSNISLGVYEHLRFHPIEKLRAAGVKVTVSSDDPPFFRTTLGKEYVNTAKQFGWTLDVEAQMTRNSIEAAFCDAQTKADLMAKLDAAIADLPTC